MSRKARKAGPAMSAAKLKMRAHYARLSDRSGVPARPLLHANGDADRQRLTPPRPNPPPALELRRLAALRAGE